MNKLILGSYSIALTSKIAGKESPMVIAHDSGMRRAWAKTFSLILIFASLMMSATYAFAQSTDATLSNLTISDGSLNPVFTSGTTSYTDNVGNAVTSITVTPTTNDPTATVTVNGNTVTSGTASGAINLNVGDNTVTVIGTAQDGIVTDTYTIIVTRAPSSDATLSNLTISAGT